MNAIRNALSGTKTIMVGIIAIVAGVVASIYGDDETVDSVKTILGRLWQDPRVLGGLAAITGRAAIAKGQRRETGN